MTQPRFLTQLLSSDSGLNDNRSCQVAERCHARFIVGHLFNAKLLLLLLLILILILLLLLLSLYYYIIIILPDYRVNANSCITLYIILLLYYLFIRIHSTTVLHRFPHIFIIILLSHPLFYYY